MSLRIAKPVTKRCGCGQMWVRLYGRSRVVIHGGWVRVNQEAVCHACQGRVRFAPRVDLAHEDGTVYSEGQA